MAVRTTVTLDPDTEQLLRKRMSERGVSFKQALNDAVRSGLVPSESPVGLHVPTGDLGKPVINLDKALQLAGELEDEEILRKIQLGK